VSAEFELVSEELRRATSELKGEVAHARRLAALLPQPLRSPWGARSCHECSGGRLRILTSAISWRRFSRSRRRKCSVGAQEPRRPPAVEGGPQARVAGGRVGGDATLPPMAKARLASPERGGCLSAAARRGVVALSAATEPDWDCDEAHRRRARRSRPHPAHGGGPSRLAPPRGSRAARPAPADTFHIGSAARNSPDVVWREVRRIARWAKGELRRRSGPGWDRLQIPRARI
jgi:hypothetical protein